MVQIAKSRFCLHCPVLTYVFYAGVNYSSSITACSWLHRSLVGLLMLAMNFPHHISCAYFPYPFTHVYFNICTHYYRSSAMEVGLMYVGPPCVVSSHVFSSALSVTKFLKALLWQSQFWPWHPLLLPSPPWFLVIYKRSLDAFVWHFSLPTVYHPSL